MKIKLRQADSEVTSKMSTDRAPQTFDPLNNNPCPAVLDDTWEGKQADPQ